MNVDRLTTGSPSLRGSAPLRAQAPEKRGIGFAYHPGLTEEVIDEPGLIDFLELRPDILCRERVLAGQRRFTFEPTLLSDALKVVRGRPLVVHGLGLSVGAPTGWNESYLDCLDAVGARHPLLWHSEHLTFLLADDVRGRPKNPSVPPRIPLTDDALDLVIPRIRMLNERYGVPFLLENLTYCLPGLLTDDGHDEVDFLNALIDQADVFLLIDLYNFESNARTFGIDPLSALSRLRLDRVVEVHVAGGSSHAGTAMDVHGQMVSPGVWSLLDWIAQRAPNLAGIVYEVLEEAVSHVSVADVCAQLVRARLAWDLHCAAFAASLPRARSLRHAILEARS